MQRTRTMLAAGLMAFLIVLLSISAANAQTVVTLNATARGSFQTASFWGWNTTYLYMSDTQNQYIGFNVSGIANNPNIVIDSASVTIAPDGGNWNNIWGSQVCLYRAMSLDFVNAGSFDTSVMYSKAPTSATAAMVFNATSLVQGWASGVWASDVGGVTLTYVNPTGNSSLSWPTTDLSGATLTIAYHAK